DLCCGTGDLGLMAAESAAWEVVGADFAGPMLQCARAKSAAAVSPLRGLVQADAQALPFPSASFDGALVAFGLRNVEDPQRALSELARVLRPGGALGVLEFFRVPNPAWRGLFRLYFHGVAPLAARLAGTPRPQAYRYLPNSVDGFVSPEQFRAWMREAGFDAPSERSFSGGVARLLTGHRVAEACE
ncbi:MAG: class I SAM-dependent methyltransferase, partial [Planctomycetota bacterium]|nr:class I SAM-dependent methyltransferase [Planctomycetota bacterium]